MLCHRNTSKFWELVFRQKINFSTCDVSGIRAGEPGADGGGLPREFLLFAMENFPIDTHFFGTGNKLFFTALPTAIISKEYCILGQLCALAILHIGRGPACFHLCLVEAVFTGRSSFPLESFDASDADGELKFKLESIKNGDNTPLIESNIFPTDDITKNAELFINYFCIISRYAAIQDFRRGFTSILKNYDKICCLQRFFVYSKPTVTLAEVRSIIRYVKRGETGSNLLAKEESAITEFEMLLLNLSQNVYDINLSDFLKFAACVDRIPPQGLGKSIDVYFHERNELPTASTCGLFLNIPLNIKPDMFLMAIKDGGTFGMS